MPDFSLFVSPISYLQLFKYLAAQSYRLFSDVLLLFSGVSKLSVKDSNGKKNGIYKLMNSEKFHIFMNCYKLNGFLMNLIKCQIMNFYSRLFLKNQKLLVAFDVTVWPLYP